MTEAAPKVRMAKKDSFKFKFGDLLVNIIKKDRCMFCGGCISSCPIAAIGYRDEKPVPVSRCEQCGMCVTHCPRFGLDFELAETDLFGRARNEDEPIGIYQSYAIARAKARSIRRACQDGGVVTALLTYAMDKKYIKAAIVTGTDPEIPWKPVPVLAQSQDAILNAAGSKYTVSPNNSLLGYAYQEYDAYIPGTAHLRSLAIVGTPCQAESLRKMQYSEYGTLKITEIVKFFISVFCWDNFHYEGIKLFVESKGLDMKSITKFDIKRGVFYAYQGNKEVIAAKLKEVKDHSLEACKECTDLTGELADINVGSQGAPDGWCFIILRTPFGKQLFDEAVKNGYLELKSQAEAAEGLENLTKQATKKREIAKKRFADTDNELIPKSHI